MGPQNGPTGSRFFMAHKNGKNMDKRRPDGTFLPGSGGRTKGARNRTTQAVTALLQGQAEQLTQAAIDAALDGDIAALRLCLERICPARKDSPIEFNLPSIKTATEAASAAGAVVKAVADGEITPLEAVSVMGLIDSYRKALELTDIENRLTALEKANL